MNRIILKSFACLAVLAMLVSCDDVMDDKNDIDAQFTNKALITATGIQLTSATATAYNTAVMTATFADVSNIIETGCQIAETPDFSGDIVTVTYTQEVDAEGGLEPIPSTITLKTEDLVGSTTYYVRAYAVTPGGIAVSEAVELTTPKTPIFTVGGMYTVAQYWNNDDYEWEPDDMYKMLIEVDAADETALTITNLFNAGGTCDAIYDPDESTIYIPSMTVIGNHPTYGPISVRGINDAWSAYTSYIYINFTSLGGLLESGTFMAYVSAGSFGWYMISAVHDNEDAAAPRKAAPAPTQGVLKRAPRQSYRIFD